MWKTGIKEVQFFFSLLYPLLSIQTKGYRKLRNTDLYIFQNKSTTSASTAVVVRVPKGRTTD